MNLVALLGNLTRDPEVKKITYGGGKTTTVANFTVASNRNFKRADGTKDKETTYVDCEAWDSGAETIGEILHKGDPVLVQGSLKLDRWETDGQPRSKLKVRVSSFQKLYRSNKQDSDPEEEKGQDDTSPEVDAPAEGDGIPF